MIQCRACTLISLEVETSEKLQVATGAGVSVNEVCLHGLPLSIEGMFAGGMEMPL